MTCVAGLLSAVAGAIAGGCIDATRGARNEGVFVFLGGIAGFLLGIAGAFVVALVRRNPVGFRVGAALVLGLFVLLLSICFLGFG